MTPEEINELRIFVLNMGHFMPLLERKKQNAMNLLLQAFNAGEDVMRPLAKVSALTEIENEVKGKLRTYEQLGKG